MILQKLKTMQECCWLNDNLSSDLTRELSAKGIIPEDIEDARARLDRFAPLIKILFPELYALMES